MIKEKFSWFRLASVLGIFVITGFITAILSFFKKFYVDEIICLIFLDVFFLSIFCYEMEYERKRKMLSKNEHTTFGRVLGGYAICSFLFITCLFLPEFYKPVLLMAVVMTSMSSELLGISVLLYFVIIITLSTGAGYYELASYVMMSLLSVILTRTLKQVISKIYIYFLYLCTSVAIPVLFYYLCYKEIRTSLVIYGVGIGIVTILFATFCKEKVQPNTEMEVLHRMDDVLDEHFVQVNEVKSYSKREYHHAKMVSDICKRCAKELGFDEKLCETAGFYYRLGMWQGEPHVENGIERARTLCFPQDVIDILEEYYGEKKLPSTKESALIHMVDGLVKKIELFEKDVGQSKWNRDIIIFQTLNEYSSSGIYDESGLSMNQFIKIREFLSKEV